jgi:hypothetical protein
MGREVLAWCGSVAAPARVGRPSTACDAAPSAVARVLGSEQETLVSRSSQPAPVPVSARPGPLHRLLPRPLLLSAITVKPPCLHPRPATDCGVPAQHHHPSAPIARVHLDLSRSHCITRHYAAPSSPAHCTHESTPIRLSSLLLRPRLSLPALPSSSFPQSPCG